MFTSVIGEGLQLMCWVMLMVAKAIWNIVIGLMNVKKAADYQARRGGR